MRGETGAVAVRVFTAPDAACGTPGATWTATAHFIGERLRERFGAAVVVEHVPLFTARSFEFPAVLAAVERGAPLPIVVVGERIVSQGGKLSEARIARAVETVAPRTGQQEGRD